ncbi:MAG: hypothetical protein L6R42_000129, partial [Xanthoria sp. 1 TBL-2021]
MRIPILILSPLTVTQASCSLQYITNSQVTALGLCHQVTRIGKDTCCCSGCPTGSKWSQPCGGDLDYPLCNSNEILGPLTSGQGYFGDSRPLNLADICYPPSKCHTQKYTHIYSCCACLAGYKPYKVLGECNMGAQCAGCSAPHEVLSGDGIQKSFQCTLPPDPCSNLAQVSGAGIDTNGNQIIVADSFAADAQAVVNCWTKNPGAKVYPTSSSRCSASQGITAAGDHQSDHQIGRAIDRNLEFPTVSMGEGGFCNSTCMLKGYCAYHKSTSQCKDAQYQSQQQNAQNKMVNDFYTCAGGTGVLVGAAHGPESVHFERDVSDIATAYTQYQKQLKAFCLGQCYNLKRGRGK